MTLFGTAWEFPINPPHLINPSDHTHLTPSAITRILRVIITTSETLAGAGGRWRELREFPINPPHLINPSDHTHLTPSAITRILRVIITSWGTQGIVSVRFLGIVRTRCFVSENPSYRTHLACDYNPPAGRWWELLGLKQPAGRWWELLG